MSNGPYPYGSMNRRTVGFALLAAVLMLVAPLAVVAINDAALARPSTTVASTPVPNSSLSMPTAAAVLDPATTLQATEQAFEHGGTADNALLNSELNSLSPSFMASVWAALLSGNRQALDHLEPALSPNCGTYGGWCVETGIAGVALAACAFTAAPTLGLGCAAAGIAVLAIGIYELWFGQNAAAQIGKQVMDLTETLVDDMDTNLQLVAIGVVNQVSALNATVNALGYEAAAAALLQLGNSSFSAALDLGQSGVAEQLAEALSAQMASITQLTQDFIATVSSELGSANTEGQSCSAGLDGIWDPESGGSPLSCPSSASSYTYISGDLAGGITYGPETQNFLWLNESTPIVLQAGVHGQYVTLKPLDGATPWFNLTFTGTETLVNFTGPSQSYSASWSSGATAEFFPAISLPLSSDELYGASTEQFNLFATGSSNYNWGGPTAIAIDGISCGPSTYTCGTNYGDTPSAESSANAAVYLYNLAIGAANQAEVYWLTLRDLGYTSASQVPAKCLIPSPAALLPQDLTPTQLASLNATAMLRIYYALLGNLAYTFNASTQLTAFNVCGKHTTLPTGSSPIGFGTYAYAYLYVPNATGWQVPSSGESLPNFVTSATASGTTSVSTGPVTVAKGDTLVAEVFSLGAPPSSFSDGLGMTWAPYWTQGGGGGYAAVYVDNATSTHGSDTISVDTTTEGAMTVLVFSGSQGIAPLADLKSTGWVNPSGGTLGRLSSVTVPAYALSVPSLVTYGTTNYTDPSSSTCSASTEGASAGAAEACVKQYAQGSDTETFGYGSTEWVDFVSFSVLGETPTGIPVAGPEIYANPETWNYSGIVSFAPAIGAYAPLIGSLWQLPDQNPSFVTVQAFTTNVTDPATGYGYINTLGPTQCATGGGGGAGVCDITTSPLLVLDYVGGNSSANVGITGSVYPTHEDGSGAGYSIYITECFTAQAGATVDNVTYTASSSGSCGFEHNTINSTVYYVCSGGEYVVNSSSCPTPPPILVLTTNGCGGPYLSWLAGPIASGVQAIPFLGGTLGCDIALVIAIVILILVVALIVWAVGKVVRAYRGRS